MRDLERLKKECFQELKIAGIKTGNVVKWSLNNRSQKRWGRCTRKADGTYEIELSEKLASDNNISDKMVKAVIIHELLHSCRGCMKHTGKWKEYAGRMNRFFGYDIKRCTSSEEMGVEPREIIRREVKYRYRCKKCGQLIEKTRACKFTKYYSLYTCGICNTTRAFVKIE